MRTNVVYVRGKGNQLVTKGKLDSLNPVKERLYQEQQETEHFENSCSSLTPHGNYNTHQYLETSKTSSSAGNKKGEWRWKNEVQEVKKGRLGRKWVQNFFLERIVSSILGKWNVMRLILPLRETKPVIEKKENELCTGNLIEMENCVTSSSKNLKRSYPGQASPDSSSKFSKKLNVDSSPTHLQHDEQLEQRKSTFGVKCTINSNKLRLCKGDDDKENIPPNENARQLLQSCQMNYKQDRKHFYEDTNLLQENDTFGKVDGWFRSKCGKTTADVRVSRKVMLSFLNLIETDESILDFLKRDVCCRYADKYLIAMVFTYFIRGGLKPVQFTRLNFYSALYLAHDMEEDDEDMKYEILPWALGYNWNVTYSKVTHRRDALYRAIDCRGVVSKKCCDQVMSMCSNHWLWTRERPEYHGGAMRDYLKHPDDTGVPRGPFNSPLQCWLCVTSQCEKSEQSYLVYDSQSDISGSSEGSTNQAKDSGFESFLGADATGEGSTAGHLSKEKI